MCLVDDGYLVGATAPHQKRCGHCGERTMCIDIAELKLPQGMTVKATILQDRTVSEPKAIKCVGIGCGSYAKFHRQMAHITSKQVAAGAVV